MASLKENCPRSLGRLRLSLNNCEDRALRILKDRETTDAWDVLSWFDGLSSQLGRFSCLGITVFNGEVHQPMRRNSGHFRSQLKHSAGALVLAILKNRIVHRPKGLGV